MSHLDEALESLLEAAGIEGHTVGPEEIQRLWSLVGPDDPRLLEELLEAVAPEIDGELPLRAGQWQIDLREAGVRTGLLSALVACALIPRGMSEFTVGFVTAVLPSVLEIRRVELGAGDRRLLLELRAVKSAGSIEELYAALPPEARKIVNVYDFEDFVERLREVGLAGEKGGVVHLHAPKS